MLKPLREKSDFMKILSHNHPMWLIFPACLAVAAAGFCQPLFGWVFSIMMQVLTTPVEYSKLALLAEGKDPNLWKTNLEEEVVELTIYILIMAGVLWVGYMGKDYIFSFLGQNVTMKIRQLIYDSILQKNIGWFDF